MHYTYTGVATVYGENNSRTFIYLFQTYYSDALPSDVKVCNVSHRGNDDYELPVLKLKHFQDPLPSNAKTFKALFGFQGLSRS